MENTTIFTLSGRHSHEEIMPVINEALKEQADFAYTRFLGFEKECRVYETKYEMNSEEFLKKFESGELGDDLHWFDWYAALRGKTLWEKKHSILRGISWKA
ncbi:hypothetical protein [Desulfonema magnum]|uniref:Uncharacterized protein n=1 Tax=Desulfonema magnum TaxID=45655 RepID=A0A975BW02_9BACT|nr:hypothetical protein [Desulfonema magnum]QTA92313.1 Uncharacterized protein dnm_083910 [Desulfonema magnum]